MPAGVNCEEASSSDPEAEQVRCRWPRSKGFGAASCRTRRFPTCSSMTPAELEGCTIETQVIDEYVQTDLSYLRQLEKEEDPTLLALAGVQSHQFQRSLDLAAYALEHGVEHCIIGGPHPMTCDTSMLHGRGVSFALVGGGDYLDCNTSGCSQRRTATRLWRGPAMAAATSTRPCCSLLPAADLRRYIVPMLGIYPARGCPFTCNFCSVIKIAGRAIRSQDLGDDAREPARGKGGRRESNHVHLRQLQQVSPMVLRCWKP